MSTRPLTDLLPPELAVDETPFDVDAFEALPDPIDDTTADGEIRERAERWQIRDDGGAEWAMRMLAAKQAEIEALAVRRDDWIERITAWFDQAARGPQRSIDYFAGQLERYAADRYAQTKAATLSLPSGKVTSRKVGGTVDVVDPKAVVEWIREHLPVEQYDDLVKDEPTPKIQPLRKLVTVVEREAGTSVDCTLECGHFVVLRLEVDEEPAALVGSSTACSSCPFDPLDGAPPLVKIVEIDEEAIVEQLVVTENGEIVPGVTVAPEGRSYTVKPGA